MATNPDPSEYLNRRVQATRKSEGLRWIAVYEISNKSEETEAVLVARAGTFPAGVPMETFKVASGGAVLGSEILEPMRFENNLLGFIGAEKSSQSSQSAEEEVRSLAAQLACFYSSKNRERVAGIDAIIEKIHNGHPEKYHWTGVYMLDDSGRLALETFRGEPTPHVIIPVDSGICGAAVREGKTLNIADVKSDSRYLSCSIQTKSEIVVPIFKGTEIVGEIDIDSHVKNAFTRHDEMELTGYAERIAELC